MAKLTPKQSRFVAEYLVDTNATQAAIRCGYSAKTAYSAGSRLLKHVGIGKKIEAALASRAARVEVKSDEVLAELKRIGFVDIAGAYGPDGRLRTIHDIPEDIRRAISSIETVEYFEGHGEDRAQVGWVQKVKLWDKPRGLELLGKNLKLFTDKVEISGLSTEDLVRAAAALDGQ